MTFDSVVADLITAREVEEKARKWRIECEEKVASFVLGPEKGARTAKTSDGVKVTVARGLIYKGDTECIIKAGKLENFYPPVKSKTVWSIDENGYEWYRKNDPRVARILESFIEVKPKKIAVSIKEP